MVGFKVEEREDKAGTKQEGKIEQKVVKDSGKHSEIEYLVSHREKSFYVAVHLSFGNDIKI